jgi:hypothetical protein
VIIIKDSNTYVLVVYQEAFILGSYVVIHWDEVFPQIPSKATTGNVQINISRLNLCSTSCVGWPEVEDDEKVPKCHVYKLPAGR